MVRSAYCAYVLINVMAESRIIRIECVYILCDVEDKIGWNVPGIKAAEISAISLLLWSTYITAHISDPLDWDTAC